MPNFTSIKGAAAAVAYNALMPGDSTERLTMRKFDGAALARVAEKGGSLSTKSKEVVTVVLKINPSEIRYEQPKITTKIQTNAPGRFVVFDWGVDLKVLSVTGSTGNMMPDIMKRGYNPIKNIADTLKSEAGGQDLSLPGSVIVSPIPPGLAKTNQVTQNVMNDLVLSGMSHYDALRLSPKFRTFERMQQLYETFDADRDVLTMELGDLVYRVYFTHFSFVEEANKLWEWRYEFTVNVLSDLTQAIRRGDSKFPSTSTIDTAV